jgi:hypothetical protein
VPVFFTGIVPGAVMSVEGTKEGTRDLAQETSSGSTAKRSLGQQRVLELLDGQSFLLQTLPIAEGGRAIASWRYRSASEIAVRLASWALSHRVLVAYRRIDRRTVRIWRLGMF